MRHLGVPYANFVTGSGDGLDVELMQLFAKRIGVEYVYVRTNWREAIPSLIGHAISRSGNDVQIAADVAVVGDVIANGMTVIPWREKLVDFSTPTFPTQIWLITRADGPLDPITPAGTIGQDIAQVEALIRGHSVLCKANTCLDPSLYGLEQLGARVVLFQGTLNELAPAVIKREAETTILDVPDALVALRKWPGKVKVIGPLSPPQNMGVAFAKSSPQLRAAFNEFFCTCWEDGTYLRLVQKYYPTALDYYPEFFGRRLAEPRLDRIAERADD